MQRQHSNFLIIQAVGSKFSSLAIVDERIGRIPVLDDI
jgi:hypothetical protein